METAPRNCRFLSLVVVERALIYEQHNQACSAQKRARTGWGHCPGRTTRRWSDPLCPRSQIQIAAGLNPLRFEKRKPNPPLEKQKGPPPAALFGYILVARNPFKIRVSWVVTLMAKKHWFSNGFVWWHFGQFSPSGAPWGLSSQNRLFVASANDILMALQELRNAAETQHLVLVMTKKWL